MGKVRMFTNILSVIILIASISESAELKTALSSSEFAVGDKINFTVTAKVPKASQFTPPETESSFGNISVKGWDIKKTEMQNYDSISIQYVITTYVPENCTIPSLQFLLQKDSTTDTLYTESIPLKVLSVIEATDSVLDIKDLRPLQATGKAPLWWLWLICSVLAVVALIIGAKFLSKRLRKPKKSHPPKPPYEEAIEALGILHGKRYLQQGLVREYVFELSEIFKRYIGRRFEVNAEEFTAEELIAWLGVSGMELKVRQPVEWFFRATDLVKFAKFTPDDNTVERFGKEVVNFLEITRPQLQEIKPAESAVASISGSTPGGNETGVQR